MTHRNTSRMRIDVASAALTVIGLAVGVVAYWLVTAQRANALVIVPSVVAVVIGVTHLVKRETPRE